MALPYFLSADCSWQGQRIHRSFAELQERFYHEQYPTSGLWWIRSRCQIYSAAIRNISDVLKDYLRWEWEIVRLDHKGGVMSIHVPSISKTWGGVHPQDPSSLAYPLGFGKLWTVAKTPSMQEIVRLSEPLWKKVLYIKISLLVDHDFVSENCCFGVWGIPMFGPCSSLRVTQHVPILRL